MGRRSAEFASSRVVEALLAVGEELDANEASSCS
jgi:hypothetical protein